MKDKDTGWVEADITINGHALSFAEAMSVRVAVSSYRMFVREKGNAEAIGWRLAEGYDHHLASVEAMMMRQEAKAHGA